MYDLTAVNGGSTGQALCAWRHDTTGNYQYGTWFERAHEHFNLGGYEGQACVYQTRGLGDVEDGLYYAVEQFYCGCASSKWSYTWGSSECATGAKAASTKPAICRVHKYRSAGPYMMGFYDANTQTCYVPAVPFGPNGEDIEAVSNFNGINYGMHALCATPRSTAKAKICLTPLEGVPFAKHCWFDLGGLTTGFYPRQAGAGGLMAADPAYAADKVSGDNEKECATVSGTTISKLRSALSYHYSGGVFELDDWKLCDNNCCDFVNTVLKKAGSSKDVDAHFPWTIINGPCSD